jgi:hypothetical protein
MSDRAILDSGSGGGQVVPPPRDTQKRMLILWDTAKLSSETLKEKEKTQARAENKQIKEHLTRLCRRHFDQATPHPDVVSDLVVFACNLYSSIVQFGEWDTVKTQHYYKRREAAVAYLKEKWNEIANVAKLFMSIEEMDNYRRPQIELRAIRTSDRQLVAIVSSWLPLPILE